MFMEQSHNKQAASVDIFPTQCSSSIGSNGVIRVSFTVRNDSLMRVMMSIQHTVTGWLWVNKIFHLKVSLTAYSVPFFSRHSWQNILNIEVLVNHRSTSAKKGKWQMKTEMTIAITMTVNIWMTMTMIKPAVLSTGAIVAWMAFCLRGQTIRSIIPDYISTVSWYKPNNKDNNANVWFCIKWLITSVKW